MWQKNYHERITHEIRGFRGIRADYPPWADYLRASLSTMTVDPLVSLLVGAFGAALLGGVGAIIGAGIQSRREHLRWVRERRFEAYSAFIKVVERDPWGINYSDDEAGHAIRADRQTALAEVQLVGPDHVYDAASDHDFEAGYLSVDRLPTAPDDIKEALIKSYRGAKRRFVAVARKELGFDAFRG